MEWPFINLNGNLMASFLLVLTEIDENYYFNFRENN